MSVLPHDFRNVKVGDVVTRMLGGVVPMKLTVTSVTEELIWCGPESGQAQGWSFDRITGTEVDEDLGWGPRFGRTGSYLLALDDPGPIETVNRRWGT